jgi:hypothetical protein
MGYDAGYVQTAPGRGYQRDIIYNHCALVDKGRCGPRCSIGDRVYVQEKPMAKTNTLRSGPGTILGRAKDRLLGAVRAGRVVDEEMLEETLGDAEPEEGRREPAFEIHNHHHAGGEDRMRRARDKEEEEEDKRTEDRIRRIVADAMTPVLDALDARLKKLTSDKEEEDDKKGKDKEREDGETEDNEKILGHLEMEAPPGTNDRARLRRARDSSFMADSFQETAALAEVLCPGIRVPTFDSAASPKKSLDSICNLRRTALDHAYHADVAVRQTVDAIGGKNYATMDCGQLRPVFLAAGEFKKLANNGAGGGGRTTDAREGYRGGGAVGGPKLTLADINKRNRDFYSKRA